MTAQFHERLILDGEETSMAFCPPLPDHFSGLRYLSDEEVQEDIKKDDSISPIVFSTACWQWKATSSTSGGTACRSCDAARRSFAAFCSQPRVSSIRAGSGCMQQLPLAEHGRRE